MNFWEWRSRKLEKPLAIPPYEPKVASPAPEPEPMIVEESIMDTVRMKALNFWKR